MYNKILSVDPPPSTCESIRHFQQALEPFAIAESPVPPSVLLRSVIPVIDPPVIATLELSKFA